MLAKHSTNKKIKGSILAIAASAQKAKKEDPSTIDGTIGMLYDELGFLMTFNSVKKTMNQLDDMDNYSYSTTSGGELFKQSIIDWTFREYKDELLDKLYCDVIATPGGSGAIGISIANYLNPGEYLITSDLGWGNYSVIAYENYNKIINYRLFDDNYHFNMDSFKDAVNKSVLEQNRAFIIINDPCHNPTGFRLNINEWQEIVSFLNSFNCPIILFLDMAYIDYLPEGLDESRQVFRLFKDLNDNILVNLGFSGSKTFSVYGLRMGALIGLSKRKSVIEEFFNANEYSARGRWSNVNHGAISMVNTIMNNEDLKHEFEDELKNASLMLSKRANAFMTEAKEIDLFCYPYRGGFFITIPCNGEEVYEALKSDKIYVIPLKTGIRISLSALSLKDISGLAKKIKEKIK